MLLIGLLSINIFLGYEKWKLHSSCAGSPGKYPAGAIARVQRVDAPGKSQTCAVESDNAELRRYITCLTRATRCFAKRLESLMRRVKMFVYC